MRSLSQQTRAFTAIMLAILLVHGVVMVIKMQGQFSLSMKSKDIPQAIKVKLMESALKTMSATQTRKQQIVQSEDSANRERPKDAAFLSDKDRSFDRQTMARNVDLFKNTALGNGTLTQKKQDAQKAEKKKALKDLSLSDVAFDTSIPVQASRSPASATEETKKGIKNGDAKSIGFSSTNDYVEDVKLGDFTHLNTVEFKYYGFFHRIRQKLEQFWGKSIQEKASSIFRSGRRLPASENLVTSLQVTLNEKGEIIGVKVLGASGVRELDDAAIESFNEAGPFPNPPKGLLVNGKAVIEWGFVVKS